MPPPIDTEGKQQYSERRPYVRNWTVEERLNIKIKKKGHRKRCTPVTMHTWQMRTSTTVWNESSSLASLVTAGYFVLRLPDGNRPAEALVE